jgi:hypothetical protein
MDRKENYKMVEYIVSKRSAVLDYLKRVHSSNGILWLNHIHITPQEISSSLSPQKLRTRCRQYFVLG